MSFCNTNVWSIVFPVAYLRKLTIYSGRIANGIPVQKGGFGLAQETIDAIRQAETAAEAATVPATAGSVKVRPSISVNIGMVSR